MDKIIQQMKQLGMTEYEVKAYLALLTEYPLNGYALSKVSGIPRSRVYEVVDGLCKKQIVFEHVLNDKTVYSPIEPDLLIKKLKAEFASVIAKVDQYTNECYQKNDKAFEPRVLKGRSEIINVIKLLLADAKHRVAISIWDEDLRPILDDVTKCMERGVLVKGIYFGVSNPVASLVSHRRIERYMAEKRERYLIIIIDNVHVISGIVSRDVETTVTWSKDAGIIEISDDFIAHDVMLNAYKNQLNDDERNNYETQMDTIRKDYYGFSDEEYKTFPLPR